MKALFMLLVASALSLGNAKAALIEAGDFVGLFGTGFPETSL